MAGPSSTSRSGNPTRTRRYFSVEQANRALPLVTRVVRDIVNTHECAAQLQGKLEEAAGKAAVALRGQLQAVLENLQDYVDELEAIGVELKDYETGLIDFPGQHEGRDIYLCWRLGEASVSHWHELHGGYSGRQPVSMLTNE